MNKFFLMSLLFISTSLLAVEEKEMIVATDKLPIEMGLVLSGIQNSPLSPAELETLLLLIKKIDTNLFYLKTEERYLMIKNLFYKSLLAHRTQGMKAMLDFESTNKLSLAITQSHDPFLTWFYKSLNRDAQIIMNSTLYRDYVFARSSGNIEKIELRKIDKKVQLISWWISKIQLDSPSAIYNHLTPVLYSILQKLEAQSYLYANLASMTSLNNKANSAIMTFFSLKKVPAQTPPKKEAPVAPSVEQIIDSVEPLALPVPSNEDWLLD